MNKILIVGHPQSGYQEVERLLRACGMAPALPSRREGFAPEQISETLCKAHSTPPLHRLGNDREVQQVDVAPVWQSLAMDLMLGNLDQPLWGWADPKAVHLLDYWLTLDPTLHFILVYDRPHSVLTRTGLQEAASLTREALQQRLDAWSAYNAAVLGFHLRHPERCLLVHSEQVVRSADASLQHVQARIDAPWKDRLVNTGKSATQLVPTDVEDAKPGTQSLSLNDETPFDASALSTVVASTLLKDQPGSQALYEELQASANLPLEADLTHGEDPALGMEAWLSMVAQQEKLQSQRELTLQLQAGREQAERLAREREWLLDEERLMRQAEFSDMGVQLEELRLARSKVEADHESAQQENELLLTQLHQAQEELERHYLSTQQHAAQIKERLAAAENRTAEEMKQAQARAQELKIARSELHELQTRPPVDPQLGEENELLLNQLHQVQEELERYYLENQRLKAQVKPPKPEKPAHYGAADRVRQQLSYRIGTRMIQNSRSLGGWISMPWAVLGEVRRFKQDQTERQHLKLPPIHSYRDAHEAERVKQHLSYRLGQAYLANVKSPIGWLRMPFALRQEAKAFRQRQHT